MRFTHCLLLLSFGAAVFAQNSAVFGGVSYTRADRDLLNASGQSRDLLGWDAAYTFNFLPRFGVTFDASGNYSSSSQRQSQSYTQYTLLGGPEVSLFKVSRINFGVRALAGVINVDSPFTSTRFNQRNSTAFAAAPGVKIDLELSRHVSWRLLQPEYLITRFHNSVQGSLRVSTGLVFRFGK